MAARGGNTEVIVELAKAGANVDMLNRVCFLLYIIHAHMYVYIWASGSEPCLWQILSYISFH